MDFDYDGKTLKFDKELSDLDKLVLDFVGLIKRLRIRYVIVSGYVSILFGRSRTTEDIDLYMDKLKLENFLKFFSLLNRKGYWAVDSESAEDAFDRLQNGLSIRMAKKDTVIPNFEIKFPKKEMDFLSLDSPLKVLINNNRLLVSPLEVQIPFKVWLGSEKDMEDAAHIYELFKEKLDKGKMRSIAKGLRVEREMTKHGFI
ncbi:MAG: hypothetical protein KGI04_01970 [Candidatus Micrarchaeota archaeon]|nr:hypothetical protein [Candidatus Micrarchaeota archaeon]